MSVNWVDKVSVDGVDYDLRDSDSVRYDESQSLTDAQKETARGNIEAASTEEVDDLKSAFDLNEEYATGVSNILLEATWTDKTTLNDDGTESANSSYKTSGYIPVSECAHRALLNNVDATARVFRVIGYDANKTNPTLIKKLAVDPNSDFREVLLIFTGYAYIRVSYAKSAKIAIFDSTNTLRQRVSNVNGQQMLADFYGNCYVNANGDLISTEGGGYVTDYIPVNVFDTIEIKNGYYTYSRSVCLYDSNKNFLEFIFGNSNVTDIRFVVVNPLAKYIRTTFRNPDTVSVTKLLNNSELIKVNLSERHYEKGSFDSHGEPTTNSNFVRLRGYVEKNVDGIYIAGAYKLALVVYNKIGTFVSRSYWHGDDKERYIQLDQSEYNYKIYICQNVQSATITTTDASTNVYYLVNFDYYNQQIENAKLFENRSFDIGLANADNTMPLVTYYGDNQIVHPKVLYFPNKFGGHKFWMAYTPYPRGAVAYENPCIAYSDDGYGWENIPGNPITDQPTPGSATDYNSDTHLVYRPDTGNLECWYRYCEERNGLETVVRKSSTDGITWGTAEVLNRIDHGGTVQSRTLSPAVFYEDGKYRIWCVSKLNGEHIDYYESTDGTNWQFIRSLALNFAHDGESYYPWHLDCIKDDNKYVLLVMCKGDSGVQWPLFIATSTDNITYATPYPVILGSDAGWDTDMYRSCIVNVDGIYMIYYSARNHSASSGYRYGMSISTSPVLKHFKGTQVYN